MKRLIFLIVLIFLTSSPSLLGRINIQYVGWAPEQEVYVRKLIGDLVRPEAQSPSHFRPPGTTLDLTVKQGAYAQLTSYHKGVLLIGYSPLVALGAPGYHPLNALFNTSVAHELAHALADYRPGYHYIPKALAEALAEYWTLYDAAPRMSSNSQSQRSSARGRTKPSILFGPYRFIEPKPDLDIMSLVWENNPNQSCVTGIGCEGYYAGLALMMHRFVTAASEAESTTPRVIFHRLTEVLYQMVQERSDWEQIPLHRIWQRLDLEFPGVRIDGMSPEVFFATTRAFNHLQPGSACSVQAQGQGNTPINPVQWHLSCIIIEPPLRYPNHPYSRPLTHGRFLVTMKDAFGMPVRLLNSGGVVDLAGNTGGVAFGQIPDAHSLPPGLYSLEASYETGGLATRSYFMVVPVFDLRSEKGFFVWHIADDGTIIPDPLLPPPDCEVTLTAPGLTRAFCLTQTVILSGQEFNLLPEFVRILQTNGQWRRPALSINPDFLRLSGLRKSENVRLENINPDARGNFRWTTRVAHATETADRSWLVPTDNLEGTGDASIPILTAPDTSLYSGTAPRRGAVIVYTQDGVGSLELPVTYQP